MLVLFLIDLVSYIKFQYFYIMINTVSNIEVVMCSGSYTPAHYCFFTVNHHGFVQVLSEDEVNYYPSQEDLVFTYTKSDYSFASTVILVKAVKGKLFIINRTPTILTKSHTTYSRHCVNQIRPPPFKVTIT